jgi:hypothetical protein
MQLGYLVRVDTFDMEIALIPSAYWLFNDVSNGLVEPLFSPQIAKQSPNLGLIVDV